MLTRVAMMPLCHCFARRDRIYFVNPKNFHGPAQAFVLKGAAYCAWGCFRAFVLESARTCRATECQRPNAIAESGVAAIHDPRMRRTNKHAQAAL
ncbi:hypothetical protein [Bradyrhizobium sp. 191]|uniref:hypothetical protein n=1 Tax=Bradyrhizobium sp. 191 TaxID=2782659 RepID=UPI001FFE7F8A|nr:hypothetical protein [Bradyrhizobium sp. 191]UPJ67666.1 hypothetical protein IVB23_09975 [Bradyrhizobium sp. 191]